MKFRTRTDQEAQDAEARIDAEIAKVREFRRMLAKEKDARKPRLELVKR